jgi:hypothetical protein
MCRHSCVTFVLAVALQLKDEEVFTENSDPFCGVPVNSRRLGYVTALFLESSPTFRMDLVTSGFSIPKRKAIFLELCAYKNYGSLVLRNVGCQSFKDTASYVS